jgi:hypothetical protein
MGSVPARPTSSSSQSKNIVRPRSAPGVYTSVRRWTGNDSQIVCTFVVFPASAGPS